MGIGIGAVHCLLPDKRVRVVDLPQFAGVEHAAPGGADASGVRTVGVHADTDAGALAARACRELLAANPHTPDALIHIAARPGEGDVGTDAARVQHTAGTTAFPFTVAGSGCAASAVTWALACDLLAADPARHSVLVTYGSRPPDAGRVRHPVMVVGDGAFAMTLVRAGRPVLVAHRMRADGRFHELAGTHARTPGHEPSHENAGGQRAFELAVAGRVHTAVLVDEVLAEAGLTKDDVSATLMPNTTTGAYRFYEQALDLPIHPICEENLTRWGHLGPMDVVLNLDRLLATGTLTTGDHVMVLGNARVAAWTVTLWKI
ncbi:3-oxoacyl-[acyl-carrier-protein] synthase III C-terminal domain-containing protein [Streptomyces sp. NPDC006638]|uniref:3-oxoacyl-[acyl-carrier-protein] synthase III C-terminal domain-containing protein n=1 Tax=Streptomyces sp. NPDC006638 TaxID=3157183 RepID=UPI0033A9796B